MRAWSSWCRRSTRRCYNPVWEQVRRAPPWQEKTWEERANEAIAEEAAALAADPVTAEAARREKRVCKCHNVNVGALEDAIRDGTLTTRRRGRRRSDTCRNGLRRLPRHARIDARSREREWRGSCFAGGVR